ncbi:MAG: hypothetical protein WCV99_19110 [Sterolibacterium sp.]|jgi:uncharacterized delta-60 repeat protein
MRSFLAALAKRIQVALALLAVVISCPAFSESEVRLDPTFAGDGVAKIAFGPGKSWATTGVTQPDGKIIVAGSVYYKGYFEAMALARTNPNGTPDNGFGDNGVVVTKVGVNSRSTAVGLMPDGRIVVAGWAHVEKGKEGITLAVYNVDGTLDSRFGDRGLLIFPVEYSAAYVYSLTLLADGKIVVGGKITIRKEYRDQPFVQSVPDDYVLLARLNGNGSFDASFGRNGVVVTDVGGGDVRITGLALQQDGKLIAAGTRQKNPNSTLVLARYNVNGSLDRNFGVEGLANRTMEKGRYSPPTISTLPDGRIFLVGGYSLQDDSWLLLSRLHVDGSPDLAFGETGTITTKTKFWRYSDFIPVTRPDGRILISGMSVRPAKLRQSQPPFYYSVGIARFLPNGDVDSSFGRDGMHVVSIGAVTDRPAYMTAQDNGRIIIVGHSDNEVTQQVVVIGLVP